MEDKATFVDELFRFYMNLVTPNDDIIDMSYVRDISGEWVYVTFKAPDSQKRFSVSGDSTRGILLDFARFLTYQGEYRWLQKDERR